jgi:Fur family ferric uptake transcriptional regulator
MNEKMLSKITRYSRRTTQARKELIYLMKNTYQPYTVTGMLVLLQKKGIVINKTTVYRQMERMRQEGIVQEVFLSDGIRRFEARGDHHHHLVCQHCHTILDVVLDRDLHEQERQIMKIQHFKVLHHSLEFFGLCQKCQ